MDIFHAQFVSFLVSAENSHLSQSDWEAKTRSHQSVPEWIRKNSTDGTGKTGILDYI